MYPYRCAVLGMGDVFKALTMWADKTVSEKAESVLKGGAEEDYR